MTKLLNILEQELDPLKTTPPLPTAPLEISPGKKCNYRQIHDAILKANPARRVASLISNTDPHTPSLRMATRAAEPGNTAMRKAGPQGHILLVAVSHKA